MDQAAPSDQKVLRYVGQCGEDTNLDRGFHLRSGRHRQEAPRFGSSPLHFAAGILRHPVRENADAAGTFGNGDHVRGRPDQQSVEFVRLLTGHQWSVNMISKTLRTILRVIFAAIVLASSALSRKKIVSRLIKINPHVVVTVKQLPLRIHDDNRLLPVSRH